jgi:cobalt-zinc-cadmium efflux system membrane fusion protein
MTWIKRNPAAVLLVVTLGVLCVLFFNGNLQWNRGPAQRASHVEGTEAGEAAEKKVSHGKVVLDQDDLRTSGVLVAAVGNGSVHETLEAPGEIDVAQNHLAQVTAPIPGRVRSIRRLTGDAVDRGGLLCTIESAELGGARADLQSALAETAVTKRNLDRIRQLFEKGLRSESEVWASEAEYHKARLHVDAASAHLRALGINPDEQASERSGDLINQYELRSPLAGTILQQQLTIGQNVEQKDVLFTVADLSSVWVNASVNERDVAKLRNGMSASVQVQTQAVSPVVLDGLVAYLGQQADQQTRTVPVRVVISNPRLKDSNRGFLLRPGMFTTVRFMTATKPGVITVPPEAVQEIDGQTVVFLQSSGTRSEERSSEKQEATAEDEQRVGKIVKPKGEPSVVFEPRVVTLGISDGKAVEIVKGLQRGDKVVIRNAFLLKSELEKEKIGDVD